MKIHVLFGQRKERYKGQYAPEAVAVFDEYQAEDNTTYLDDMRRDMEATGSFESLAIIHIEVSDDVIEKRLMPEREVVPGKVV